MGVPENPRLVLLSRCCHIGLFLALLLLPLADQLFGIAPKVALEENRNFAKLPPLPRNWRTLASFPAVFEAYYKDNFGFRRLLIQAHTIFKTKALGQSPNRKVLIGRHDWLYFTGEDESLLKYGPPLTDVELRDLTGTIAQRKRWYERQGVGFFILIPPNKQSLYPEYLPEPQRTWSKTNLYAQLVRHFTTHSNRDVFVDVLGPILREKKAGTKVYHQTDSHWNDGAAWQAYLALMARLGQRDPQVRGLSEGEISWLPRPYSGDLVRLFLGVPGLYEETTTHLVPRFAPRAVMRTEEREFHNVPLTHPLVLSESPGASPRKIVFLRDSQLTPLIPYFSESFQRVVYIHYWEKRDSIDKIIAAEQPDFVIHEMVERNLKFMILFKEPNQP
jgi:alginate O-acetyltransferase complex protein AlgJ